MKADAEATKANETYDADYKAWEKARDKYIEVEAIDINAGSSSNLVVISFLFRRFSSSSFLIL